MKNIFFIGHFANTLAFNTRKIIKKYALLVTLWNNKGDKCIDSVIMVFFFSEIDVKQEDEIY